MFDDAAAAQRHIAAVAADLARRGVPFRAPPPEPTTCCGRGCNGCVWEGWSAAVGWWLQDAGELLAAQPASDAR